MTNNAEKQHKTAAEQIVAWAWRRHWSSASSIHLPINPLGQQWYQARQ